MHQVSLPSVEQRAENACLVDVHLVLSVNQVFVFLGSLGQFGHGAVDKGLEFWEEYPHKNFGEYPSGFGYWLGVGNFFE